MSADEKKPAPAGTEAGEIAMPDAEASSIPHREAISDYPFALEYAAERAVAFAEVVFELDREAEGLDWASCIQARCDASLASLHHCLPPGLTQAVRERAERLLS